MIHRLKAAVFGTGFVGRVHLEAIRRLGFVQVYAIGESQKEKARRLGEEFHVDKTASDYHLILDDPEVDAVHVCTPNALHFPMVTDALNAGKHVICEKPLSTSVENARKLAALAKEKNLRNCTFHNLRFYPIVQQMRRMREAGELGEILVVQGGYAQDWLLYDTDWNWRIDSTSNGPSRCMADIGSHWCDMAEHVTGQRITSLCADLQTFHKTRKRPKKSIETFAGKTLNPEDYDEVPIDTEDFGAVLFRMGDRTRGAFTASQVNAGRKNGLSMEDLRQQGFRRLEPGAARRAVDRDTAIRPTRSSSRTRRCCCPPRAPYADLPGGHSEGYDDTFKQVFRRFYRSVEDPSAPIEYPQFVDGLRQLQILDAELASTAARAWMDVPS